MGRHSRIVAEDERRVNTYTPVHDKKLNLFLAIFPISGIMGNIKAGGMHMNQDRSDSNQELREATENCQTALRGTNDDEYQNYVAAAQSLGWDVKSYDEWLGNC